MPPALFDTHAHLHFPEFADDLPAVLERARAVGVAGLVTIGTDIETSLAAIALAGREADVWAAVGIHPHDAAASDAETVREIERLARSPRVVAIGEIGLDFFRNLSPPDVQAWTFRALLEVAGRLAKPVLIHCREAHDETLAILAEARLDGAGGIAQERIEKTLRVDGAEVGAELQAVRVDQPGLLTRDEDVLVVEVPDHRNARHASLTAPLVDFPDPPRLTETASVRVRLGAKALALEVVDQHEQCGSRRQ